MSDLRKPFGLLSRLCAIPRDLKTVTTVGDEEAPLRKSAVSKDAIEALWKGVESVYRTGLHPAIQVSIRHDGRMVLSRALGHARGNGPDDGPKVPKLSVTTETPFTMYSASKAVTALVMMKLDELGLLHIEDRICDYVPEFAKHGKEQITIRHVLSHRAGVPAMPRGEGILTDPDRALAALCDSKPVSRAGRTLAYHAASGGYLLAAVVQRATGRDIRAALRQHVADPLGLRWMNYGVKPDEVDQVADDAFTGPPVLPPASWLIERALGDSLAGVVRSGNSPEFRTAIIPSANVVTTAEELSKFYMCLAEDGAVKKARVFDPRTIRRVTTEQSYYEIDWTLGAPLRWGLGVMLGGPVSLFGLDTDEAFGHLGFTNILGWADPARRLGVAIVTSGKPFLSLGTLPLANLVIQISRTFPR